MGYCNVLWTTSHHEVCCIVNGICDVMTVIVFHIRYGGAQRGDRTMVGEPGTQ